MKRRILTLAACLGLLGASAWLVTNPVGAFGEYKITCADGSSKTCSGTHCEGRDDGVNQRGYCSCSTSGQPADTKWCPTRGDIVPEESDS